MVYSPVIEFQKRIVLSAVPPPDTSNPCWWGDHARALTAAVCFNKLAVGWREWRLQIFSLLSFPPEANCCWSKDHFNPQTYCLCPASLDTYCWSLKRKSLIKIFLSLEPLANILFVFHAIAPTLPLCPVYVYVFLFFTQSQSWTCPECVPTPKTFEVGLEDVLVTKSFSLNYTNLTTLELPAFQIYTLLLNPTESKLFDDQSIKLR